MSLYISSFITGFQSIVKKSLPSRLKGFNIKQIFDGIVLFEYGGNWKDIITIPYLNNSFLVTKVFKGNLNFNNMIHQIVKMKSFNSINMRTFRVRFSKENQFVGVDKKNANLIEQYLKANTKMRLEKLNPNTEFWFIIRRENIGFFAQLLQKRKSTEKNLNQGELRQEFAFLMCESADISKNMNISDPFAGFGAIPKQLVSNFKFKNLFVSDLDKNKINILKNNNQLKNNGKVTIFVDDALKLEQLKNESIDAFITDPPWGYYEHLENIEEFYKQMLRTFNTKLSKNGEIVILSARKNELNNAIKQENFIINKKIDTLVNGKKTSVFILQRKQEN